jgi:mono/diheme cytochrome c family protein
MSSGLRIVFIGLAFVLVSGAGCGRSESPPPTDPIVNRAPAPATEPRASEPPPAPAPPVVPSPAAPPAASSGAHDPAAGEALYLQNCSTCHGVRGGGDGPVGAALDPKPARHDDGAYMNALSNEHLFQVIQQGGVSVGKSALMAPWGASLGDQQIWNIVAFVRTLAVPAYTGPKP